ncbi:MAG: hypothetical protein PF693_02600, partial [Spirochaetia bacterium]|nr:hypothetical protein [Spirochaetia bacterium]
MKRHFIRLLSVIILFFTVDAAFAQLGVELIGDEIVGIIHEPVIRHGLLISNDTSSSIHVQLDAELPRGFKALLLPEPMDIMPGSKKIVLFAVQAADTVPAGIWEYRYRVTTSPKDGEIIDKIIKVTVPARPALMLRVLDGPDFVLAGQKYETAFELTNRGNVPMAISLEPFSSDESSITI